MSEDTKNIWTGTDNFDEMLQTLIVLQLEEQLRNPLPYLLENNFIPATLVSSRGRNGTVKYLAVGDMAVDVSDGSGLWVVAEGEPNDSEDLDIGFEEFSVRQGMRIVKITDVADLESPIDLITVAGEKVARVLMEIANAIAAKTLIAGDNTYFVGGDSNPTAAEVTPTDILTGVAVREAVAELEVGNVPTFADQTYRAFQHPYVKLDLRGDTADVGFIEVIRYANPSVSLNNEIGTYSGVRFIKSIVGARLADAGSSSNDVFVTPIIGPRAIALGDFGAPQTFFTPPGGHDDPAHQSALVAVKGFWGGMIVGEGDNASGPVSGPRYINVYSGSSKSVS
jgi:N4-gp56 family major capsid protein